MELLVLDKYSRVPHELAHLQCRSNLESRILAVAPHRSPSHGTSKQQNLRTTTYITTLFYLLLSLFVFLIEAVVHRIEEQPFDAQAASMNIVKT